MKFEFIPYRESVSDEELIADLVCVAKKLNSNTITQQQYIELGKYGIDKYLYRFKNWNGALEKAKLNKSLNYQHSAEELFENIERVWIAKGKQPTRSDMNNRSISKISGSAYMRRFGTWSNALQSFSDYMNAEDPKDYNKPLSNERVQPAEAETRTINLRLRWKVMRRDNFKCCCCGASPATSPSVELHVDHIIPWSKGGRTALDNLQTLCSNCNLGKGDLL